MIEKYLYEKQLSKNRKMIESQRKKIRKLETLIVSLIEENEQYKQKEELVENTLDDYKKAIELAEKAKDGYEARERELVLLKKEILRKF